MLKATYKPQNPHDYYYGAAGEVVFAYSDGCWHNVIIKVDPSSIPAGKMPLKFLTDRPDNFEFDGGDYYDFIRLWQEEKGIMEDEISANRRIDRSDLGSMLKTVRYQELLLEQEVLRESLDESGKWENKDGKYIRPKRHPLMQRALDCSNVQDKVKGTFYLPDINNWK